MRSFAVKVCDPARMSPKLLIGQVEDILAGSLAHKESEPARMSPLVGVQNHFREGVKNTFRGGPSNSWPKAVKPCPPFKFVNLTCTPLKMATLVKTPPRFGDKNIDKLKSSKFWLTPLTNWCFCLF